MLFDTQTEFLKSLKKILKRLSQQQLLLEQFQYGKYDVVDIAETWGFRLLGVMEAATPVDSNVRSLFVQFDCPSWKDA